MDTPQSYSAEAGRILAELSIRHERAPDGDQEKASLYRALGHMAASIEYLEKSVFELSSKVDSEINS